MASDSFQLYDLKVEVVCPPGARILCGANEGDFFTLEGELLRLPAGQGISIYSLGIPSQRHCQSRSMADVGSGCASTAGGKAAPNTRQRLDDERCTGCLSGPELPFQVADKQDGPADI